MRNRLKQIRSEKGITQEELAKAVGITRPYLSDIERGIKTPGGHIIIRIANYFKLPVEEIFFENDVNHGELKRTANAGATGTEG